MREQPIRGLRSGQRGAVALALCLVVGLAPGSPSQAAGGACDLCDGTYLRCRDGTRRALEDCQSRLGTECRTKCNLVGDDDQGTRDPTRFTTCLRNCGRAETCEPTFSRDSLRCGSVRAFCRRRASCPS